MSIDYSSAAILMYRAHWLAFSELTEAIHSLKSDGIKSLVGNCKISGD